MERQKMKPLNVVLVHGAWTDGSSWTGVTQRLQKEGQFVTATQHSLASLNADVATVRGVLANQNGPTILVAHSFGGAIVTKLGADAPNVAGLVFVAAFAPDQGESMKGLIESGPQPASAAALRLDKQGFFWLDRDGFIKYFAPDVNPAWAQALSAAQKPIAASEFFDTELFGPPAWKMLPAWYLVTENDQMIPPDAQRLMAKRMGATISSVTSSHVAMISHPDVVTALIVKAAEAVQVAMPAGN
jgi:pimeloyl-ACP methyl ester carboxylesterase